RRLIWTCNTTAPAGLAFTGLATSNWTPHTFGSRRNMWTVYAKRIFWVWKHLFGLKQSPIEPILTIWLFRDLRLLPKSPGPRKSAEAGRAIELELPAMIKDGISRA